MTLIEDAKKGIITKEIEIVAIAEGIDADIVRKFVSKGLIAIPKNYNGNSKPIGIGKYMSTKINANIGTSMEYFSVDVEIEKAKTAQQYGADTLMDLSTGGDIDAVRKKIMDSIDIPIGTVPIYQAALKHKDIVDMTSDDMFNVVRKHAKDGVDFITVHSGINQNAVCRLKNSERIMPIVSRGGSFTVAWMIHNEEENPFYAEYDYLLEIAYEYDMAISIGDGMRPGCINDASDRPKFMEFITIGELVKRTRAASVQSFVEGPGHVPIDEIELSVKAMKHLCDGAPLYLLGPLVTDIAPGYDHITAAIGGTVAGMHGADFLCMTTPAEHLALPNVEDIRDGAIVTKIAAHAADLVKDGQRERARERDFKMAHARKNLDWDLQYELAIDGVRAREVREKRIDVNNSKSCSMCGKLCSMDIICKVFDDDSMKKD